MPGQPAAVLMPNGVDHVVQSRIEYGLGRVFRVHRPAERGEVGHADVVKIGQENPVALHKGESAGVPARDKHAVTVGQHIQQVSGYISGVDDAVIGEEADVLLGAAMKSGSTARRSKVARSLTLA